MSLPPWGEQSSHVNNNGRNENAQEKKIDRNRPVLNNDGQHPAQRARPETSHNHSKYLAGSQLQTERYPLRSYRLALRSRMATILWGN